MAKKTVATLQTGKTDGRSYSKVIKMVKTEKGSYTFDERMVPNEAVQEFFKNYEGMVKQNRETVEALDVLD